MPPSTKKRFEQACLATKKSHGPRSQVLFDMCYQVLHQNFASFCKCPSPELTLKGGYCQTMPIVTKPTKIVALIELYTEQFTSSFIIVIKSSS